MLVCSCFSRMAGLTLFILKFFALFFECSAGYSRVLTPFLCLRHGWLWFVLATRGLGRFVSKAGGWAVTKRGPGVQVGVGIWSWHRWVSWQLTSIFWKRPASPLGVFTSGKSIHHGPQRQDRLEDGPQQIRSLWGSKHGTMDVGDVGLLEELKVIRNHMLLTRMNLE